MEYFYSLIIVFILILSIFDLIVGLINDAVNFLNSAIGSKVATKKIIMMFASLGIILGSFLSSGMMEIARKGVFNPSYFYFSDVIFIFLSVMISDIILLDIFNTLGLPTSTTVSMIFCLSGGAFSIALIKIFLNNESFYKIIYYIKTEKALSISLGIFLSIIISFLSGSFIHYFIRSLFSFNYKNKLKYIGVIWGAISLSSMTYFLIIRGLYSTIIVGNHNIKFINGYLYLLFQNFINWIHHNFFIFTIILFSIWIVISKFIIYLGYNILKFVVLYGTFSLAMAFAGNDLVNFIGVPIASIQSYNIWKNAGFPSVEHFLMKDLSKNNIQIPSIILILSGIIMILTLWFSKKTKNITSTEINLSRQNEGEEKFLSNFFSRLIVRFFLYTGNIFKNIFPKKILSKIEKNFRKKKIKMEKNVSFDLVRASANLTISSILISIATVQKLPLSTTFVTFMVSMGTSLSDRAWDRESAVYRVSGVLNVIRGWILTAIIAFTMAGVIVSFLYFFKVWAFFLLFFLISFFIYRSYKTYYKIKKINVEKEKILKNISNINIDNFLYKILEISSPILDSIKNIYIDSIEGITRENFIKLKKNRNHLIQLINNFTGIDTSIIEVIKKIDPKNSKNSIFYFCMYNLIKDIIHSSNILTDYTFFHVINCHKPLKYKQKKDLLILKNMIVKYFKIIQKIIDGYHKDEHLIPYSKKIKQKILSKIEEQIEQQFIGIIKDKYGTRNTILMVNILTESKKITKFIEKIILIYHNIYLKLSVLKKN